MNQRPRWAEGVVGQELALQTLDGIVRGADTGRFVLLHGATGVGKATTASKLASYFLCRTHPDPCGECLGCRDPESHPDADVFRPEKAGAAIKIDPVREASARAYYPPINARYRVWLLDPVERLSDAAANALLRILEEPPRQMWALGIAHNLQAVPVTLRSRAFKVPFRQLSAENLQTILGTDHVPDAGTVQRAGLLTDEQFQKNRSQWVELIGRTWYDPDAVVKFARSAGGKGGNLQTFLETLLLTYDLDAIASDQTAPYNGEPKQWSNAAWDAFLGEREHLIAAIADLQANVNPAFVCEDLARRIRKRRKQLAAA